jgi:hypothetical protein
VLNPEAIIDLCTTLPLIFPIKKNELAVATIEYNKALLIDTFEPLFSQSPLADLL